MLKNKHWLFYILTCMCLLLTGCTVTADRIYTVCKVDKDVIYCYKADGSFYTVSDKGVLESVPAVGLKAYPALSLTPSKGDYDFKYVLPGLYKGTLESVNNYVYKLCDGDNQCITISYADYSLLDVFVKTTKVSTRIIYSINGDVRIYAQDNSKNSEDPLYLNKE